MLKQRNNIKISVVSLLVAGLTVGVPISEAADYTVQAGDSLWKISQKFNTSISRLKEINNLKTDEILIGEVLTIPDDEKKSAGGGLVYTVKSGDSLYFIALDHGTTVTALKKLNNLTGDEIRVGQQLIISPSAEKSPQPSAPADEYQNYTVAAGDSLYFISKRYGITVDKLMEINSLSDSDIYVGQVLKVPANSEQPLPEDAPQTGGWNLPDGTALYYVQSGDWLSGIAQKYNSSVDAIMKTNNLKTDMLTPEQPLIVPVNSKEAVYGITAPSVPKNPGFGELLDWEYANWLFNHQSTAVIKDLETGITFNVYRIGGGSHADCEPLTADDTAIMKSLFGGEWSWQVRPVILQYQGREIAASMAGMPHAFDTVSGNNFNGMFDIHFLNSRTHNTDSKDPNHQQAVLKAAGS